MKRGVIHLSPEEVSEALNRIDLSKIVGKPIESKLMAAKETSENNLAIELSQEEAEDILDFIVIPLETDTDITLMLREKLQNLLNEFSQV